MPRELLRLSSRSHAIVRACRDLASTAGSGDQVLLDGVHLVAEALAAHVAVETLIIVADEDRSLPAAAIVHLAEQRGATVYEATQSVLDAASPVRTPSGMVAIARWAPVALTTIFAPAPTLTLGLVDVQDPGNVGGIIRSADALGATGVAALGQTAHPGGWKALRGAMGSTFLLPVARSALAPALAEARRRGMTIVATVPGGAAAAEATDLTGDVFLLLGHEGGGLADDVAASADARVTVPMREGVNSLNVGVTAALLLYEARRQRQRARGAIT
jgi:TrmH family RNA methyltransferase